VANRVGALGWAMGEATAEPLADNETEAALVARAKIDRSAFAALYARYLTPVYRFGLLRLGDPHEAEDAPSLVFQKALAALPGCRDDRFRPWLFAIARNVVADRHRARIHRPAWPLDAAREVAAREPGPEQVAVAGSEADRLRALLGLLTDEQRSVVELRLAGLTDEEIGRVLGKRPGAARPRSDLLALAQEATTPTPAWDGPAAPIAAGSGMLASEATARDLAETVAAFLACSSSTDLGQRWALLSDAAIHRTLASLMASSGEPARTVIDRLAGSPWNADPAAYDLENPRRLSDGRYVGLLRSLSAPGGPTPIVFVQVDGQWRIDDLGTLSEAAPIHPFVGTWQQRGPDGSLLLAAGDGTAMAVGRDVRVGVWHARPDGRVGVTLVLAAAGSDERIADAAISDESGGPVAMPPESAATGIERFTADVPVGALSFAAEPEDPLDGKPLVLGGRDSTFDRPAPPDFGG